MTGAEHRLHMRQIRRIYREAASSTKQYGREWYEREHTEARSLAITMGLELRLVCACLAVLSPRCQWPRVKSACRQLLSGENPPGIFGHNLRKAAAILQSQNGVPIDPNTAPKTWAFWQNLWHPNDPEPVTLDSWMFRAHDLPASVSFSTYQTLADCYRVVAEEVALVPNQLQATVWLHVREKTSSERKQP